MNPRNVGSTRNRQHGSGFPVIKPPEEFKVAASSVPQATFDYLAGLEWIPKAENPCLVGPAGTGKSHLLVALGHAAVAVGHKVRYLTAAELVEQLYRGVADNSVGRVIDTLLRHDLVIADEIGFAPLDDTGTQLPFRFVAAAYERRATGVASHWPFEQWGRFPPHTSPPPACSTGSYTTPPSSSPKASRSARGRPAPEPQGVDHDLTRPKAGTIGDHQRRLFFSDGPLQQPSLSRSGEAGSELETWYRR
jgi:hypothetical protein